jgi:hypothetical protein
VGRHCIVGETTDLCSAPGVPSCIGDGGGKYARFKNVPTWSNGVALPHHARARRWPNQRNVREINGRSYRCCPLRVCIPERSKTLSPGVTSRGAFDSTCAARAAPFQIRCPIMLGSQGECTICCIPQLLLCRAHQFCSSSTHYPLPPPHTSLLSYPS